MDRDKFHGFHQRPASRDMHVCPRCGTYAPWGQLCRDCQVSQIPGAGFIFAQRRPEGAEAA